MLTWRKRSAPPLGCWKPVLLHYGGSVLEKGLAWCGVIWVREKEYRLDINLFLCAPLREPDLCPCDVKRKKIAFSLIIHNFHRWQPEKSLVGFVTLDWEVIYGSAAAQLLWKCLIMKRNATQNTDDRDPSLHRSNSHPLPVRTGPYGNCVISCPLLVQNTKSTRETGTRPLAPG